MKKFIYPIFLLLLISTACKKDKHTSQTDPIQYPGDVNVTGVSPTTGLPNTLVTITGSNFGNTTTGLEIEFSGEKAIIESVKPTEIKVRVPITTTGQIIVIVGNQIKPGPMFTYIFPELNAPYVSGDVTLHNQAEIDAFVALNKGKKLKISGNLKIGTPGFTSSSKNDISSLNGLSIIESVSGSIIFSDINLPEASFLKTITSVGGISISSSAFTLLSFANLRSFSGSLVLNGLSQLNQLDIHLSERIEIINISSCPILADLSFLNNITSLNNLYISGSAAASITLDQLKTASTILLSGNRNLTKASFKSLETQTGGLSITYSTLLTDLNFKSLKTLAGKLSIRGINISDMSGFESIQTMGSLQIESNASLVELKGLERLNGLSSSAIVNTIGGTSPISRVNGIFISNNPILTSLTGLQNVTTIPIAYISDNPLLNDICPFKAAINALDKLSSYSYTYTNQLGQHKTDAMAALTLTRNGNYVTKQEALNALALCK